MKTGEVMVGWTTVERAEDATRLARGLVEGGLAACVQVTPGITSVYRWNGRVEQTHEIRLTAKFASGRANEVKAWLEANHPYEVPQWVCVPVIAGSEKYLNWVLENSS